MSFPKYPEYKDSGVEWLGEVPAHWGVVKLGYLAISQGGGTPPKDELRYWNGSIPWVTPKDMKQQWITSTIDTLAEAALHASPVSMIEPGHVLVVFRSGILRHRIPVAINKVPVTVNQDIRAYNVRPRLLPDFFLRLTQGLNRELLPEWSKQGATVESLDSELVSSTQLPVPPREEQEAITAFLDHEAARIDALVEEQQRLIELLKEKRQAVISHAVIKGLDPDVPMKDSGVEWLGKVPAHWNHGKVRYFAKLESGHTPSRNKPEYWENCTIPWFTLADVWKIRSGRTRLVHETKEKVSALGLANSSARLLPAGTVILSRTASVGYSAILGRPMATTQDFANWICREGLQPEYLLAVFRSMKSEFSRMMMGSTHKTIYMPDIAELCCAVPPITEQAEIVAFLDKETARIDALVEEGESAIKLLQERRSALISAAVTGKIDVRGWQPPAGSSAFAEATQPEAV